MTPRPGTARYERLANFLEDVMRDPKASRRIRLSAALRLDNLLQRAERREASEARRAEREAVRAAKAQEMASGAKDVPAPNTDEDATMSKVQEFIESIRQKA